MEEIYVVIESDGDGGTTILGAFSNELDAQEEVLELIQQTEMWYTYRKVEWRG